MPSSCAGQCFVGKYVMKVAIYARVSTSDKEQNPDTQLFALREFCSKAGWEIAGEYVDYARAKDFKRRVRWQQLLKDANQYNFKVVLVFRLDRAFRSVRECTNIIQDWFDRGVTFKSLREDIIDTSTSQGKFILHIMAAVAELESGIISERVTAGIARTIAEGNRFGRKPKPFDWSAVKAQLDAKIPVSKIARDMNYSRAKIYRAIEENKSAEN